MSLDDLRSYLDASPSPFHAAANAAERLTAAGFTEADEGGDWSELAARGFVRRDGGLVAWHTPDGVGPDAPFRLAGAHTDSPCLRIKPHPDQSFVSWKQLNVEVYGGILNNDAAKKIPLCPNCRRTYAFQGTGKERGYEANMIKSPSSPQQTAYFYSEKMQSEGWEIPESQLVMDQQLILKEI